RAEGLLARQLDVVGDVGEHRGPIAAAVGPAARGPDPPAADELPGLACRRLRSRHLVLLGAGLRPYLDAHLTKNTVCRSPCRRMSKRSLSPSRNATSVSRSSARRAASTGSSIGAG